MREIKEHGTTTGYSYGCRCDACRDAKSEYVRQRRKLVHAGVIEVSHGTTTGYSYGCRCDACRDAIMDYQRDRVEGIRNGTIESNLDHGCYSRYKNDGCRCDECTRAWKDWHWCYMQRSPEQRAKARQRTRERYAAKKAA